jgi:2-oxoglutarate ferredoxin oxidoreductase subunit alpha
MIDINIIISGSAGQGVQTVGSILSHTIAKSGYFVFSWQEYESRIRGGSNSYRIRVTEEKQNAPIVQSDVFLPLDVTSRDKYLPLLKKRGILIDEMEGNGNKITIPFTDMAKNIFGTKLFANTIAIGALSAVLSVDFELLESVLKNEFANKDEEVINKNITAAKEGYKYTKDNCRPNCGWKLLQKKNSRYMISGNEAAALGSVFAGCRFISAYPMTPSTGIITFLAKYKKELKIFTEQAEDEIAAINMALGASYAGIRAMTATSGGGFALMCEGISLAGMTETPVVIVLAQRPGPATGLPTRTEQADLLFAINAGHGEFPKLVFAPSDPQDVIDKMIRAFDLADKYQIPAIVITDQFLAVSKYTLENIKYSKSQSDSYISDPSHLKEYKRYRLSVNGISPRLFPGQSSHLVCCDSDEHDESGHITENFQLRNKMVEIRLRKIKLLQKEIDRPEEYLLENSKMVLISWGSTRNAVFETVNRMREEEYKIGAIHFTELWPLPKYRFQEGKIYFSIENNSTGQLSRLLRGEYNLIITAQINRYDGLPLDSEYIIRGIKNAKK